jgi:hypothetical protein
MSQRAVSDIEVIVMRVCRVEVATATFVNSVKNMRANTTSKDRYFILDINVMIVFGKLN